MESLPPVPRDYVELGRDWSPLIRTWGRYNHVPDQELDDFVNEVLAHFIARDTLAYFDPSKASFATFLRSFVAKRSYSFRRALLKFSQELSCGLDAPLTDEGDATFSDLHPDAEAFRYEWIFTRADTNEFYDYLSDRDPDLCRLFELIYKQVLQVRSDLNLWHVAKAMGVSLANCQTLYVKLRAEARAFGYLVAP